MRGGTQWDLVGFHGKHCEIAEIRAFHNVRLFDVPILFCWIGLWISLFVIVNGANRGSYPLT